jgi:molybdopterin synthase catalytic subunit
MAGNQTLLRVSDEPLDPGEALAFISDPSAGGECVFIGRVRESSDAGDVTGILYEAWSELADARLAELADELLERWACTRVALLHRYGRLAIGDAAVVVAVSAPHRSEAFEACRHGIERIKKDLPIWKKELLVTGEAEWVVGS